MADLSYDHSCLSSTAIELTGLATAFHDAGNVVSAHEDALGHREVVDALQEFAHNWRRHREGLETSLTAVAEMATAAHDTFAEVDDSLARKLAQVCGRGAR